MCRLRYWCRLCRWLPGPPATSLHRLLALSSPLNVVLVIPMIFVLNRRPSLSLRSGHEGTQIFVRGNQKKRGGNGVTSLYDYLFILLYHLPGFPISDFSPSPSSGGQWSDQPAAYCPARLPVPLLLILTSRGYFSMLCRSSILSSPCSFGCILSSSTLLSPHSLSSFSNASFILCIYAVCLSRPPLIPFPFGAVLIIPLSYLFSLISSSFAVLSTYSPFPPYP